MDKLLRKNNELSAILEVSRVLTSSFDLEKNLMNVMKILSSRLEMQRGCVFLLHKTVERSSHCGRPTGSPWRKFEGGHTVLGKGLWAG